jgi:hypothetical protein
VNPSLGLHSGIPAAERPEPDHHQLASNRVPLPSVATGNGGCCEAQTSIQRYQKLYTLTGSEIPAPNSVQHQAQADFTNAIANEGW